MASWRERESQTQPSNRRGDGLLRCECGDETAEYESVRAYATHFAIARNPENPESEQVIDENERFTVVETVSGEAAKLARRSYP